MNKNVLIVLAGGFLVAILVAVLVQATLGKKGGDQEAQSVQILVAAKTLSVGRKLKSGDLKWQRWPETALFQGAIVREEDQSASEAIEGRVRIEIAEGQPVLETSILKEAKGNFLAAALANGMRAVAISVKAHTMAGGFIGPGDFVDVIITHKVRIRDRENQLIQSTINEHATETILENVLVLAVDQESKRNEEKAKVARTVTLAVSSEGAEKLALAAEMGDIRLSLRGLGDKSIRDDKQITTDVQMSRVLRDIAKMQGTEGVGTNSVVRIYNGDFIIDAPVRRAVPLQPPPSLER